LNRGERAAAAVEALFEALPIRVERGACRGGVGGEERLDLGDRHLESTQMSKQRRLAELMRFVVTVPRRAVDSSRHQQAAVTVETESADREAGALCELADRKQRGRFLVHRGHRETSSW